MSTPDTPPQSPLDAPGPAPPAPPAAPAAPPPVSAGDPVGQVATEAAAPPAGAEPASNGHLANGGGHDATEAAAAGVPVDVGGDDSPSQDATTTDQAEAPPQEAGTPEQAEAQAQTEHGEKKRRRRRRKKKPGAMASGDAAPADEGGEAAADVAPEDGAAEDGGDQLRALHASASQAKRKKEKKASPPRERPPVNGGDIVFGKILAITDEAIIVDIPGKAHAIFDRREMLLPDDDDSPPRPRAHEHAAAEPAAAPDDAGAAHEAAPAVEAAPVDVGAPEAPAIAEATATAPDAAPPPVVPETPETPVIAEAPADEHPEPVKEPTVPRVILEVGADFIAVVHNDGARGGLVVLTHHPNRAEKAKPLVEKAFNEKTTVMGLVTGVIKGGVEVDIDGLRAFAPGSHVDLRLGADLSHLVSERLPFVVTQYAKRGRDLVLSRRAMLEEEAQRARAEALAKLKVGEEIDGVVRSVVSFGAFVDVGGIEGLVPLQEMSHNRADGPAQVFKAGEPTRVKVIKIDDRGKVWLSRKATIPDPWQQVAQKYAVGTRHAGKVARLQPFGAFVELESGVDGLIHTQDLSIKRIETPSDVVKVDDPIDVVVAHVDPVAHKIGLHPAPQGDSASEAPQRVQPHKPVKAKVVTIESGGLVVRVMGVTGRNARGYVTAAGTGTPRGTELRKVFSVGQEIEGKVIEIDPRRGEVKLSIKALSEDQERSAYQQYRQQLKAEARFTFGDLLAKKK